jgi:ribonuclease HI
MRVFTDGSCTANGQKNAKAGYAVWFPEHPGLSESHRVPDDKAQTNQRAELSAIHRAAQILDLNGCDEDVVVYTDSAYSISCLTEWIAGWVARNWKTSAGKDVLHRDLIEETATLLSKRKSHKFVHVKAHTGGTDDLSKQNDVVDRMARESVEGRKIVVPTVPKDELATGCPLTILGPSVAQSVVLDWVKTHLDQFDADLVNKHMMKLFAESCKAKKICLTKHVSQRTTMLRAEVETVLIEKVVIE